MHYRYTLIFSLHLIEQKKLTPIHCCALFNASIQVCQILMSHPFSERAALTTNAFGATPLHLAAAHPGACTDTATAIGTSASALKQDRLNKTPLHLAAQNKHATSGLIESILELNNKACEMMDDDGNLPLHVAVQAEAKEHIVESLLRACPAAAQHTNKVLDTVLHIAVKHKCRKEVIQLLINQNRNALTSQNKNGDTPLHFISSSESPPDVIELLLEVCTVSLMDVMLVSFTCISNFIVGVH